MFKKNFIVSDFSGWKTDKGVERTVEKDVKVE